MIPQQPQEPVPKSTEQTKIDHQYEVLENGDVKVIQKQTLEFIWAPREFLSLYRGNEKALEDTRLIMSEKHINKMKDQEETILKELDKLKPIVAESERLGMLAYEKLIQEGMTKSLKLNMSVELKDINESWWTTVWAKGKDDRKQKVIESLDADEKSQYLKVMQRLKRKHLIK